MNLKATIGIGHLMRLVSHYRDPIYLTLFSIAVLLVASALLSVIR